MSFAMLGENELIFLLSHLSRVNLASSCSFIAKQWTKDVRNVIMSFVGYCPDLLCDNPTVHSLPFGWLLSEICIVPIDNVDTMFIFGGYSTNKIYRLDTINVVDFFIKTKIVKNIISHMTMFCIKSLEFVEYDRYPVPVHASQHTTICYQHKNDKKYYMLSFGPPSDHVLQYQPIFSFQFQNRKRKQRRFKK